MSSSGSSGHSRHLPAETEHVQRAAGMEAAQKTKWWDRQRFFEDVFQHDVDTYLSAAHLQMERGRPPASSISSMEVNIDMLEQMELMDISDQDALDVFLNSGGEEDALSPASSEGDNEAEISEEVYKDAIQPDVPHTRRVSSTSSDSSDPYSEEGAETPVVQSEDEEGREGALRRRATPPAVETDKPAFQS